MIRLVEKCLLSALSIIDKEFKFCEKKSQTDERIILPRTAPFLDPKIGGISEPLEQSKSHISNGLIKYPSLALLASETRG